VRARRESVEWSTAEGSARTTVKVLAGDIGGTKSILAVVDVDASRARVVCERRFDSAAYPGLAPMVRAFVQETREAFERVSFGVAGPVIANRAETTNLPWTIDGEVLASELGLGPTRLVNDFVAAAYGVLRLGPEDLVELNPGRAVPGAPIGVLGAGTGLGQALLVWTGEHYEVVPSEGGHGDWAPCDERQLGLWRWLHAKHGHVSVERVVSGGLGLGAIYEHLRDAGVAPESPAVRAELAAAAIAGVVIGPRGVDGSDALCAATLDLFVAAYGAEAGNLALRAVARGGVYVCGGVAPRILPKMTDGRFRAAYRDKGRLSHLVEEIPAHVVVHPRVGLLGAAVAALR
jgi:glucokinase